ncbi:PHB depolymerase family esterase [Candidatus Cyanaurora vandensis]|uniref:extracellular catalytic domain type 1 short-chain-length polyhydroxyalkanoate depolymerase n=1 Tax=Candidatus Cyanaurora vandensis TaxID=2714958 RepID=UPI00257E6D18|nr:PHB depolymerase family esterase [Candidatus Cyanaurora vandensis]
MRKLLLSLTLILGTLGGVVLATRAQNQVPTGDLNSTLNVGGVNRSFKIHIPPSYNGTKPVPLVLTLHGRSGNGDIVARYTGMSAKSDQEGFIVAYPNALGSPSAWNSGYNTGRNNGDDVAFLRTLIDRLQKDFNIDTQRIYVTGHSSGAMMSYRLGAELSDRIAAIAPVAGSIGAKLPGGQTVTIPDPKSPVSVVAVHGQQDPTVPYNGSQGRRENFLPVAQSVNFWVKENGCNPTPQRTNLNGNKVIQETYGGCQGNTNVSLYTVVNGNHSWPGAQTKRGKENADLAATDVIWDFFERHPRAGTNLTASASTSTAMSTVAAPVELEPMTAAPTAPTTGNRRDNFTQAMQQLDLTPSQQQQMRALYQRNRGNMKTPQVRAEAQRILSPSQLAQAKQLLAQRGDSSSLAGASSPVVTATPAAVGTSRDGFQISYQAGTRDEAGKFMGGTELRLLTAHKGKVYAGIETWMDRPGNDPAIGAQILVLDSSTGRWRLDHEFTEPLPRATRRGNKRNEGVTVLQSVTFTTDAQGRKLDQPVSVLFAACRDFLGVTSVYSRDDRTGRWVEMRLDARQGKATVRSLTLHQDRVTKVDRVFVGTRPVGIFSGVYDPNRPGNIRWDEKPEIDANEGRPMAFAEANGSLYMIKEPAVFRRIDGAQPRWEKVYSYPPNRSGSSGLRGLTAIPNPKGQGESLLAAMEGKNSYIVRIDPADNHKATQELNVTQFAAQKLGKRVPYAIVANNTMTPVAGGNLLISLQIHPTDGGDASYLVRQSNGNYQLQRVLDPRTNPRVGLTTTRTMVVSPFPEDRGQVVFLGGFDADDKPTHNAAWVVRASVDAVLGRRGTS